MSSLPPDQLVTASDLVRHFGIWQDRAARAPVYILHRGRARLVMTSVDLMDALCAPHAPESPAADVDQLLAGLREPVVIADRDQRVTAVSRAGVALLGAGAAPGAMVARAWPSANDFVAEATRRVVESGIAETIDVASPRDADRRHAVCIEPLGDGVALFGRDITSEERLADVTARNRALETAFTGMSGIAIAHINRRGFVDRPDQSLAAVTALSLEALASARFVSLFEIGSRVAVGDAFESVMRDASPARLDASLLVNRSGPLPVRVALAPVVRGPSIEAVIALIAGGA